MPAIHSELKLSNRVTLDAEHVNPDLSTTWLKDWDTVHDEYDKIE